MMNKKEIFKKVGGIITELNDQYQYLSQNPDSLNELELELFSANANFLSDHIAVLVKLNENAKKSVKPEAGTEPAPGVSMSARDPYAAPLTEASKEDNEVNIPDWKFELETESSDNLQFEGSDNDKLSGPPLSDEEARVMDEETKLKPVENANDTEPEMKQGSETEKESLPEMERENDVQEPEINEPVIKEVVISERTVALPVEQTLTEISNPTVNDLLSKQATQSTIASQFNQQRTKDLKNMISLNDKLLFVRDLFNGYSLAYSEAIELLNRFDRFEAADNFLKQNYSQKNKWEDKQAVADRFYEILTERFK